MSERIAKALRLDLYSSLINKDVEFFDSKKTGDLCKIFLSKTPSFLVSRLGSDTAVIQDGLSTNVSMFLRSFLFILVAFVFLFLISWELTLVMIGTIIPVIAFSVFYGKYMKVAQKKVQDNKAHISTIAEETFSNIRTVKAFATELDETRRFSVGNDTVYEIGYQKSIWYGLFNFVANFFVFGSMAAILVLGAKLVEHNKLTIGEITSFLFYMMQILLNFMVLASVLGSVMSVSKHSALFSTISLLDYRCFL
jgi:ABC-type multidrug transport system fused ATPase/permease subunit